MPIFTVIVPGLLWLWLFWHLHYTWSLAEQYNYGWAVPFLAAVLFYQRWQTRPAPQPRSQSGAPDLLGWLILLPLFPLRVIEEANPDWRLLSWVFALLVVAFSLNTLLRIGGRVWVRHFLFPICFPLVAVPWLVQFENGVVHALTRAVAYLAVEIAGWLRIAAYQVGNVIQLANGFVGVDEACSGVKTLQASIMVALFLGELLALSASRRIALVAVGCGWVVACNVFRATALVVIAAQQGIAAMQQWHDAIGWAVLILGMGGLSAAAFFLSRKDQAVALAPAPATPPPRPFTRARQNLVAVLWLGTVFVLTELWYRAHEDRLIAQPAWEAHWPAEHGAQAVPIAETARAILRYNEASSAAWTTTDRAQWWGFFARWAPGRTALQLVRSHSPEICLPAIGRTFKRELPLETLTTGAGQLHFRGYQFEQNRQPLFVFVCIQEDKIAPDATTPSGEWSARGRMLAAWRGQRNLGQRLIEVAVLGLDDFAQARAALEALAPKVVRPGSSTG